MTTVQGCLEVSTVHLPELECADLLPSGAGHRFVGPASIYWFSDDTVSRAHVLLMDEGADPTDGSWRTKYPALAGVVDKANELGAGMVLIDPDVDEVDGLERFEW